MSGDYSLTMSGSVRPPEDMMAVARVELSEPGFERLMEITAGTAPTPMQLVREVEFERVGHYPPEPLDLSRAKRVIELAGIIAAAKLELSDAAFRDLMTATNFEPTAQQLVAAVEARG
jgi:hypothetical protein